MSLACKELRQNFSEIHPGVLGILSHLWLTAWCISSCGRKPLNLEL